MFKIQNIQFSNIKELTNIIAQIALHNKIIRINIFTKDAEEVSARKLIEFIEQNYVNIHTTFISIPVLNSEYAAELLISDTKQKCRDKTLESKERIIKTVFSFDEYRIIYYSFDISGYLENESSVLNMINEELKKEVINTSNIIRQWNYIENITSSKCGDTNYNKFNIFRRKYYETAEIVELPAATGIGCNGRSLIEMLCITGEGAKAYSIENPKQTPAYKYSENVYLQDDKSQFNNPLFSRAKLLINNVDEDFFFISGTASIFGEDSKSENNLKVQFDNTMSNIRELLNCELLSSSTKISPAYTDNFRINSMRVYIKNQNDYAEIIELINKEKLENEPLILQADLCRDELLVEIEATAEIG